VAVAGLYLYFFTVNGRRFQVLGWMYLIPLVLFFVLKGRGYYLEPAYPVLFAGGSTWMEQSLAKISRTWMRSTVWTALWLGMGANILVTAAFWLPLAPINSNWWSKAVKVNGDFREEVGWPELVETIARIHDSLPPNERARVGILAGNYGEAGAINLYGSRYGLPTAMSGINSFWQRGYGDPPPEIVIVLGYSRTFLERHFESCMSSGLVQNRYGVANEETTDHAEIFVCRRLRGSWPEFWKGLRHYG